MNGRQSHRSNIQRGRGDGVGIWRPEKEKNGKRQVEVAGKYNNVLVMIRLNRREALTDGQRRHKDPGLELV